MSTALGTHVKFTRKGRPVLLSVCSCELALYSSSTAGPVQCWDSCFSASLLLLGYSFPMFVTLTYDRLLKGSALSWRGTPVEGMERGPQHWKQSWYLRGKGQKLCV